MSEDLCGDVVYKDGRRLGRVRAVSIGIEVQTAGSCSIGTSGFILLIQDDDGKLITIPASDVTTRAPGLGG